MTHPVNALELTQELMADGFREGPPAHLHAEMVMEDIDSYSTLECEACGHGRHKVTPFHRGSEYRLACVCRSCGNAVRWFRDGQVTSPYRGAVTRR
ncbi:MAG: hypothetical protein ACYC3I_02705 [Gemmataceae bacterium]